MRIKNKEIAIFTFGILFLSSFVPVIQVMLAYLNGALIYLFEIITTVDRSKLVIPINLILLFTSIYFYCKWTKIWQKIITVFLIAFSINGIFLITFDRLMDYSEYYWLPFIIEAIIISTIILIADIITTKRTPVGSQNKK